MFKKNLLAIGMAIVVVFTTSARSADIATSVIQHLRRKALWIRISI